MKKIETKPLTLENLNSLLSDASRLGIDVQIDGAGNTIGLAMDMRRAFVPVGSASTPAEAIAFVITALKHT